MFHLAPSDRHFGFNELLSLSNDFYFQSQLVDRKLGICLIANKLFDVNRWCFVNGYSYRYRQPVQYSFYFLFVSLLESWSERFTEHLFNSRVECTKRLKHCSVSFCQEEILIFILVSAMNNTRQKKKSHSLKSTWITVQYIRITVWWVRH